MRLILDTVTFIWAVSAPERLSRSAMAALRKRTTVREISAVSLTEVAVKQTRGKIAFSKADAMAGPRVPCRMLGRWADGNWTGGCQVATLADRWR